MPNYKGTRCGLGFKRVCVRCSEEFEIYSNRQKRCSECSKGNRYVKVSKEALVKDHKWFYKVNDRYFYLKISATTGDMSFRQN